MNELINYEAVNRTAPATLGLLIIDLYQCRPALFVEECITQRLEVQNCVVLLHVQN